MDQDTSATVYLDATLRPYRSLSKRGFLAVMIAVGGGGFLIGGGFFLAGAWPVAGFCGLEIALVYAAFKLNFRDARQSEHLLLSDDGLELSRISPSGERQVYKMEPGWLSVSMDNPPRHNSRLTLQSHGKETEIGRFLMPEERLEVAIALRDAIGRYRALQ